MRRLKSLTLGEPGEVVVKREVNKKLIYECWCDERLKAKDERSTRLTYTLFSGEGVDATLVSNTLRYIRITNSVRGWR